ncbi:quercetin dioxygenase-like cupin family protein [Kribbella aluminosa]|uniref:Quercetin dioxygenase-like cupin family protein n=1 Tax=Kribbella aluminosa TaxID=416017 RepID=A0ABS4UIG0_9ACTN|nr:cupin domain-containing protein [Kribbella aluminosa]MBP2351438.1 quercetin dioxygenase-like cupin family protein [Kribbella aluminosa]
MTKDAMDSRLRRAGEHLTETMPWGRLEWSVSAHLGNSETMTIGTCFINRGSQNGRHFHPNCDEVLRVVRGRIIQSLDGTELEMNAGDVVSIPSGVVHHARNIGAEQAELAITFSSAYRETVDVDGKH